MTSTPSAIGWDGKEFLLGDDLVVTRVNCSELFVLNSTARTIWDGWRNHLSVSEISTRLANSYGVQIQNIEQDVETAITEWKEKGLIGNMPSQSCLVAPHAPEMVNAKKSSLTSGISKQYFSEHTYQLHDFVIQIRFENAAVERVINVLFAYLKVKSARDVHTIFEISLKNNRYELHVSGKLIISDISLDGFALGVLREIIHAACFHIDPVLVMHAGAVAKGVDCIALPGCGGSGKSTLTAALISDANFNYLCDDMVPLERETLRAIPFPISLNVKKGSLPIIQKMFGSLNYFREYKFDKRQAWYLRADEYNLNPAQEPYPIKCLVFPKYSSKASTELCPLSPANALQRLFEANSVYYKKSDMSCISSMVDWIGKIPSFKLTYASVDDAVDIIDSLFSSS